MGKKLGVRSWSNGVLCDKVRMYLDEIDRYRKAHVYDASNLSHKLDKHTKLFCSMNGSSSYVKVSTKGGKYYPLIYPESAGPRKCGHAFFDDMGYLRVTKKHKKSTRDVIIWKGVNFTPDVIQKIIAHLIGEKRKYNDVRHKVSTVHQTWGDMREQRKSLVMVIYSGVLRSHLMKDRDPEMMKAYRCVLFDYILYNTIFITQSILLFAEIIIIMINGYIYIYIYIERERERKFHNPYLPCPRTSCYR